MLLAFEVSMELRRHSTGKLYVVYRRCQVPGKCSLPSGAESRVLRERLSLLQPASEASGDPAFRPQCSGNRLATCEIKDTRAPHVKL